MRIEDPKDLIVVMMGLFKFRLRAKDRDLMDGSADWDFMRDVTFYPFFDHDRINRVQWESVQQVMGHHGFDGQLSDRTYVNGHEIGFIQSIAFTRRPA